MGCFPHYIRHREPTLCSAVSARMDIFILMELYDQKLLDVAVHGRLQTVSVNELFQLIVDGFTPTLSETTCNDLKRLMWLTTQIFIQGDWILQPSRAIPFSIVKEEKPKSKR